MPGKLKIHETPDKQLKRAPCNGNSPQKKKKSKFEEKHNFRCSNRLKTTTKIAQVKLQTARISLKRRGKKKQNRSINGKKSPN